MELTSTLPDRSAGPVGFVGLGTMGGPMCRRLAGAGFDVVAYDCLRPAVLRLSDTPGIRPASSLSDLAGLRCVLTMLPDGAAVRSVVLTSEGAGPGLAGLLPPGAVVVDTSSSAPADTKQTAAALAARSIGMVDAPVSGSPAGAGRGELTLMVGGAADHVAQVATALAALGSVHHVGPLGAGHALKALNNLLSAVNLAAAVEVLVAAERHGIDPAAALAVVNRSTGRNDATERKIGQFVLSGTFDSGFRLRLMAKDIGIALDLLGSASVPAGIAQACGRLWREAAGQLPENADNVEIARVVRQRSGPRHPVGLA